MKKTDYRNKEALSKVVERYQYHSQKMKSGNPMIAGAAAKMREVDIWQMWALTQE